MRHEAWSDGSFFPVINRSAAALVEPGATLVWTVDAASWNEAMTRYHGWHGWEPYKPMDDEPLAYTPEQELEAAGALESHSQQTKVKQMATDGVDPDDRNLPMERTFGRCVHESLLARYGQPVLSSYQDIQQLKSADRQTTVTLLYGAEAAASDRFQHIRPDDIVNEIAERVEKSQQIIKAQGNNEKNGNVLSGLLDILGNALNGLG